MIELLIGGYFILGLILAILANWYEKSYSKGPFSSSEGIGITIFWPLFLIIVIFLVFDWIYIKMGFTGR